MREVSRCGGHYCFGKWLFMGRHIEIKLEIEKKGVSLQKWPGMAWSLSENLYSYNVHKEHVQSTENK